MKRTSYIFLTLLALAVTPAFSQQDSLSRIIRKFDEYRNLYLQEEIFMHTDRSFYITGETMWMRLYYLDASFHKPLDISKVAYIDVLDADNKTVAQTKISMTDGGGSGALFLPATITSGFYTVRAYTQWMRNYSPDLYFHKNITISNPFTKLGLKPVVETKPTYDVQILPEGGNLVAGLKSKVGVRVVNQSGLGIDFQGALLDELNDTIAHFQPHKFGLGQFTFTPKANHNYKAIVRDGKGNIATVVVPVQPEGYVIGVRDTTEDRIVVEVNATFSGEAPGIPYVYMVTHTRQILVASETRVLAQGKARFIIPRKKLGAGISHITIFNDKSSPVCERLYFKYPDNNLKVEVQPSQSQYGVREKVDLNIFAHTQDGAPSEANLSIAVYKADSLESDDPSDIVSYLWLKSEMNGTIESPSYYFDQQVDGQAMENLLLTHGWSRYRWTDILKTHNAPEFIPEFRGHLLTGKVMRGKGGPSLSRVSTYLSTPGRNIQLYLSRSNEAGKVQFEMQHFYGSRRMIIQTNTPADSDYRVEIVSPFSTSFTKRPKSTFDIPERFKAAITQRSLDMQIQSIFYEENNKAHDPEIDSIAFYGKPDEKYLLDDYTRFPTMEEVMREYVPGVMVRKRKDRFHFLTIDHNTNTVFRENPLVLLDGVPVNDINKIMAFDPRKIQRLDVMTRKYFLGHLSFEGLVSYTTYHGDLSDFELDPQALNIIYEGLQLEREFFSPQYETVEQRSSRMPDSRDLLFWSPEVKSGHDGKQQLSFYTSDVGGQYIGIAQGITHDGKPATTLFRFRITNRDNY